MKFLSVGLAAAMVFGSQAPFTAFAKQPDTTSQVLERLKLKEDKHVQAASLQAEKENSFTKDTFIVKYTSPLSPETHTRLGTKLLKRFSSLGYDIVQVKNADKLQDVMTKYASIPEVTSISRSAYAKLFTTPDIKSNQMYHLDTLHIDKAQALAGKNHVRVAVVDTGIDASHPELKNKIIVNYNIQDPLKKGLPEDHATHVAGIIGAEKGNGLGGYGIDPNVSIISIDTFNRSYYVTDYVIAEGILEAIRQKAQVINLSLGMWFPSPILQDAVKKAIDANITVVAAAGNDGAEVLNYPAAFDGVISVGATNNKNELADFSTYGPSIDIVAPGEDIYSSVYDYDKGSSFTKMSGTSMAAPVVTGTVALLLSKYPRLTPYEVNYILNETAQDLGAKGYDTTFGHGLVNPVAALQFDLKKIPKHLDVAENQVLQVAKAMDSESVKGTMLRLNQVDWYKIDVKKGDYIQTSLSGSATFDYKYDLLFFPEGASEPSEKITVNDGTGAEGNLFEATENGTLAIGVADVYGNYNQKSTYNLNINRANELTTDENTEETPVEITSLPFTSDGLYFTNEATDEEQLPGDSDFFKFKLRGKSTQPQNITLDVSAVPGINSNVSLYMVQNMEEVPDDIKEYYTEEKFVIDHVDENGFGVGETFSFEAIPGTEYMIEVTNKPAYDPFLIDMMGIEMDLDRNFSSNLPYHVTLEKVNIPADADGYPVMMEQQTTMTEDLRDGDLTSYFEKKEKLAFDPIGTSIWVGEDDWAQTMMDASLPIEFKDNVEGYFQYMGDEDLYAFTTKKDAIYQFSFKDDEDYQVPWAEFYTFNEETNSLEVVGGNIYLSSYDHLDGEFAIGLKADKTYYMKLSSFRYRTNFKPYSFTSKIAVENVNDEYEDNDSYERATPISFDKMKGNFATNQDLDYYYFEPKADGLYGFSVQPNVDQIPLLPADVTKPIDPVVMIIEDTNKNKQLDPEEEDKFIMNDYSRLNQMESGSFKASKAMGYFIVTYNGNMWQSSVIPYTLQLASTNQADEDSGVVVKNHIPSKTIALENVGRGVLSANAYLNVTANKGDVDYYKFTATKEATYQIKVDVPVDLDAVLTLYNEKGAEVAKVDHYARGDYEQFTEKLSAGNYYLTVEDVYGNASIHSYKVTITGK